MWLPLGTNPHRVQMVDLVILLYIMRVSFFLQMLSSSAYVGNCAGVNCPTGEIVQGGEGGCGGGGRELPRGKCL